MKTSCDLLSKTFKAVIDKDKKKEGVSTELSVLTVKKVSRALHKGRRTSSGKKYNIHYL